MPIRMLLDFSNQKLWVGPGTVWTSTPDDWGCSPWWSENHCLIDDFCEIVTWNTFSYNWNLSLNSVSMDGFQIHSWRTTLWPELIPIPCLPLALRPATRKTSSRCVAPMKTADLSRVKSATPSTLRNVLHQAIRRGFQARNHLQVALFQIQLTGF